MRNIAWLMVLLPACSVDPGVPQSSAAGTSTHADGDSKVLPGTRTLPPRVNRGGILCGVGKTRKFEHCAFAGKSEFGYVYRVYQEGCQFEGGAMAPPSGELYEIHPPDKPLGPGEVPERGGYLQVDEIVSRNEYGAPRWDRSYRCGYCQSVQCVPDPAAAKARVERRAGWIDALANNKWEGRDNHGLEIAMVFERDGSMSEPKPHRSHIRAANRYEVREGAEQRVLLYIPEVKLPRPCRFEGKTALECFGYDDKDWVIYSATPRP
jgi:hypothetical protein